MSQHAVVIVGGARTPMAEYVGAFKDVSAIDLGARAASRRARAGGRAAGLGRPRRHGQRPADLGRRDLRRAPRRPQGGRARRGARADREPAVRLGHPVGRLRRADDPPRRVAPGRGRRHGEHDAGAARRPRRAHRAPPRRGQARGLADGRAARHPLRPLHGADLRQPRAPARHLARGQDAYALRSQQAAAAARDARRLRGRDRARGRAPGPQDGARRGGRPPAPGHHARRPGRASSPRSARTASSPPATPAGSWTARPRWSWPHEDEARRRGLQPLARIVSWGVAGVPPGDHGHRPRARHAQGAGGGRPRRSTTWTSSRSTRPSPASTWPWRRSWASTARSTNVNGGAIALGHPLGATGTRLLLTLALRAAAPQGHATAWPPPASAAARASR